MRPPRVQEAPDGLGPLGRPLLPAGPGEGVADVHQVVVADATCDKSARQLRQHASHYRRMVEPVRCLPRAAQQIRLELDVRNLEAREFLCRTPVAFAVVLVRASGHPAKCLDKTAQCTVKRR